MAQLTGELSQAREQLVQARRELEDTKLQLQAIKEAPEAPSVRRAYADVARTPPGSVPSLASSASRSATSASVFCTDDGEEVRCEDDDLEHAVSIMFDES